MGWRMMRTVDIRLRNSLAEIGAARDALDDLANEFDMPMKPVMQLQIALDEVLSNVVKYSWQDDLQHEFLVRITVQSDGVDLDIFDDGQAFDPLAAPVPPPLQPGQRPLPGGLGIHMIKKLLDDVKYERIDGCNHITLCKKFGLGAVAARREK
jgi:anti-sigma regulatory factor (Ser/Thr protein kinase)